MDATGVVTPPHVAGPLRLEPFAAHQLVPARVGNATTGRAFARPYRDVSQRLQRWQERGLVRQDLAPALYLHEYTSSGLTVRGLVGALDVSRRATRALDRAVLPHEGIHPRQADELADRMEAMRVNPAPILLVHRARDDVRALLREVRGTAPTTSFTDRSEQQHRIWAIREPGLLDRIAAGIARDRALIADGHHRYAAYLRLQRRHADPTRRVATDVGLAMLIDHGDTPLFLGPIHRTLAGTRLDDVRDAAEALGLHYEATTREVAVAALSSSSLVVTDARRWARLVLPAHAGGMAVEVLHRDVVPQLAHGPSAIAYHHSVESTLARAGTHEVAVLMPAPSVDEVISVAEADRLLPEKATSFQPKPSLGVLIRAWPDAPPAPR